MLRLGDVAVVVVVLDGGVKLYGRKENRVVCYGMHAWMVKKRIYIRKKT